MRTWDRKENLNTAFASENPRPRCLDIAGSKFVSLITNPIFLIFSLSSLFFVATKLLQ